MTMPPRTHIHHVPGGYVLDDPPSVDQDSRTLGCVFARDITEAVERVEQMLDALRAAAQHGELPITEINTHAP